MSIVIENLCKSFGTHAVLQSFCWTVDRPMVQKQTPIALA